MSTTSTRPHDVATLSDGRLLLLLLPLLVLLGAFPLLGTMAVLPAAAVLGLLVLEPATRNPHALLYAVTVPLLLPTGLLPGTLQSLAVLAGLGLAGLGWVRLTLRERRTLVTPPVLLLLLFWGWALLSVTWAPQLVPARQALVAYALNIVYLFLAVDLVRTRRQLRHLLTAVAVTGWTLVGVGLLSLLVETRDEATRLTVFSANSNQFGNVLLLCTAGVLWRALDRDTGARARRVVGLLAYLALSTGLIALLASRGSLLASAVLLLALATARRTRPWALGVVVIALLGAFMAPAVLEPLLHRLQSPDPRQATRLSLLQSGFDVVADRPLLGQGVGNGSFALPEKLAARSSVDRVNGRIDLPAHNPLVEVAMDTGLPGGLLFAGALVTAAAAAGAVGLRAQQSGDEGSAAYATAIGAVSLAYLVVWSKSGGMAPNASTYVLLALWSLSSRAASGTRRPSGAP